MATTTTTTRSAVSPVERLRTLTDTDVTVTTHQGSVTGNVLSCTRLSVWLICDDVDHVIALDEILDVVVHSAQPAA